MVALLPAIPFGLTVASIHVYRAWVRAQWERPAVAQLSYTLSAKETWLIMRDESSCIVVDLYEWTPPLKR